MDSVINIWIGTEHKTNLPCKVLEHSILKHSKFADQIKFFKEPGISWKNINARTLGIGTGFSLQRWYIPEKFNYEGFCIYLDADMLVFYDIVELWNYKFELSRLETSIACTFQSDKWFNFAPATSVMLIDNKKAKDWLYNSQDKIEQHLLSDKDRQRYIQLMHAQKPYVPTLPLQVEINWNRFNKFSPGTKLLHYTIEPKQPWYNPSHQNKDLWRDALLAAVEDKYISPAEIKVELNRYVEPSNCCRGQGLHPYWKKFVRN